MAPIKETSIKKLKTRSTIPQGGIDESLSFTEETTWLLSGHARVPDLMLSGYIPFKGAIHPDYPAFICENGSIGKEIENGTAGGYAVTVSINWKTRSPSALAGNDLEGNPISRDTPPWLLPPENYRVGTMQLEESLKKIWVPKQDESGQVIPGEYREVDFVNTAGTPMIATVTRNLQTVSFAYNVQDDFPDTILKDYVGTVNAVPVVVCGVLYDEIQLQVQSLESESMKVTTMNEAGTAQVDKWRYKRISVQLLADPKTFGRWYENIGTEFIKPGETPTAKRQIWTAPEKDGERIFHGSLVDLKSGKFDGMDVDTNTIERVEQPMYLDKDGGIVPIDADTGKQAPFRLKGIQPKPVDFEPLGLPVMR